jgi:hypothetical protein
MFTPIHYTSPYGDIVTKFELQLTGNQGLLDDFGAKGFGITCAGGPNLRTDVFQSTWATNSGSCLEGYTYMNLGGMSIRDTQLVVRIRFEIKAENGL